MKDIIRSKNNHFLSFNIKKKYYYLIIRYRYNTGIIIMFMFLSNRANNISSFVLRVLVNAVDMWILPMTPFLFCIIAPRRRVTASWTFPKAPGCVGRVPLASKLFVRCVQRAAEPWNQRGKCLLAVPGGCRLVVPCRRKSSLVVISRKHYSVLWANDRIFSWACHLLELCS